MFKMKISRIEILVSAFEKEQIKSRAKDYGLSVSEYCHRLILDPGRVPARELASLKVNVQLTEVLNKLNSVRHHVASRSVSQADIVAINEVMTKLSCLLL